MQKQGIKQIVKVVGYTHHQYIKEKILTPLGLNNTFSLLSEVGLDDVMSSYFVGVEESLRHINTVCWQQQRM